jgi:hypothetical protein
MSLQDEIDKLTKDKDALAAEFTNPSDTEESTKQQLATLIPEAIAQISMLVTHAESESVRFAASKYVLEHTSSTGDTIEELIKQLKSPTTPTT